MVTFKKKSVAILGAGISGLSVAYALKKRGMGVTVYEKSHKTGGVIQSRKEGEWLVESGPNTMLVRNQKIWDLLDELDLTNHIVEANKDAKKRFIIRDGQLCPLPSSLPGFLTTRLFSAAAKLRLLKEPFIPASSKEDEVIADFITRRLGQEILDYAVNPFVTGIYAGSPQQLSIKHTFGWLRQLEQEHGSIAKGLFKRKKRVNKTQKALLSFDEGLQLLPQRLQQELGTSLKLHTEVKTISKTDSGWTVATQTRGKRETHEHSAIISTLPAYQLPSVLQSSTQAQQLSGINYVPMSILALGFRKKQIAHLLDGFGMLIPGKEPFKLLGCLFSSSLFPNRAPKGHALLTCFIGGARHPRLAAQPTEVLKKQTLLQLNQLLGIDGEPVFSRHTYWPQAIPQFAMGHEQYVTAINQMEQEHPGLFVAGNFASGVSVPDCITSSFDTAEKVERFLGKEMS